MSPTTETSVARYCALLQVTEAITSHHDLERLFRDLAHQLPGPTMCASWRNLIERAVILSQETELHVPLADLKTEAYLDDQTVTTLEAAERELILKALREANWVIGGPLGGAARLGMKRTMLQSKMQKLGIVRPL